MDFFAGIANVGKGMALGRIGAEFKQIPDEWIQRWAIGEVFFLKDYVIPLYGMQLPQYKNIVIPMVDSISAQEIQQCAMRARPELMHIWHSQEAINRISSELMAIKQYVSRL